MFSPEKERMHDPMAARCDSVGPDLPRNAFTGRSCERLDGARDDASLPSGAGRRPWFSHWRAEYHTISFGSVSRGANYPSSSKRGKTELMIMLDSGSSATNREMKPQFP
jgi:hypothetical protein